VTAAVAAAAATGHHVTYGRRHLVTRNELLPFPDPDSYTMLFLLLKRIVNECSLSPWVQNWFVVFHKTGYKISLFTFTICNSWLCTGASRTIVFFKVTWPNHASGQSHDTSHVASSARLAGLV